MAAGSTKVVVAALVGNGAIAVTKFIASTITGSSAMFAEAVHSLVDTGNQALLLYGMGRAKRKADAAHPFGYGKEIYFWAFVVALLLFAMGAGFSFYEGVHKLLHPKPITHAEWNYAVLGCAIVFEAGAWWIAYKEFNKLRGKTPLWRAVQESKDPTVFTVLFEDTAAMVGLFVALVGVLLADQFGQAWADGAATLVIGGVLAVAATLLAIETKGLLIGEGADPRLVSEIIRLTEAQSWVHQVNEARTMHLGPQDILVNLSVDASDGVAVTAVEAGVTELEGSIKAAHVSVSRVFIEIQRAEDSRANASK